VLCQRPPWEHVVTRKHQKYNLALRKPSFDATAEQDEPLASLKGCRLLPGIAPLELVLSHRYMKKTNMYLFMARLVPQLLQNLTSTASISRRYEASETSACVYKAPAGGENCRSDRRSWTRAIVKSAAPVAVG
jgi:hypothetical protein